MFIHVFFIFPETANKPLEEVAAIFEDTGPGSIKYLGTPAWKTHNDRRRALQMESNEIDPEEKISEKNVERKISDEGWS